MIVVSTEDFEVYHGVVNELRNRGAEFTTQRPDRPLPEAAQLVITGTDEDMPADEPGVAVIRADPADPRGAVESALARLRDGAGRTIVGIDPGERPGVAVCSGDIVIAAFHVPLADVAGVVREEIEGAIDPVVRIGDGARLQGAGIVDDLPDVRIELVDETGTTPSLGTGTRGMGDVLAAVNIARQAGEVVEERPVEPTAGELQAIKDRSRRRSTGDRTISETLARRVATGELSMDEALAEHRDR